jgi:hypothetical protein
MNNLVSAIKSKQFIEAELKEFYTNFDKTFLLLSWLHQWIWRVANWHWIDPTENGEYRIKVVALIRLGIKDSAKIAVFLRYSVHYL